jgi:hypothetical protein
VYAEIHHYPLSGHHLDDDGEDLVGYYFVLFTDKGISVTGLIGPYTTGSEAEEAAEME